VAPAGRDSNAGTATSPWTLARGVAAAGPGETVVLADGLYAGQPILLARSGEPGRPITIRAADGALPVLEGAPGNTSDGAVETTAAIHDIVIDGIFFRGWRYGGVGIGWDHHGSSRLVVRHCVADQNLMNGISLFFTSDLLVEHNVVSRNGWGPDSWSSNVNIYAPIGANNIVRGNVSFHGIDTSANKSDGNGFIIDLALDQGSALFENNLAFGNGGSCISVTDSRGARLLNNTCYHNLNFITPAAELWIVDTCRDVVDGIPVNGRHFSLMDAVVRNNVAVAATGQQGLGRAACGASTDWVSSTVTSNLLASGDGTAEFANPAARDFRPRSPSPLVDTATGSGLDARDNGFDPRCLKPEGGQRYDWWTHAPDEAYIRSIGGIARCFAPSARPQGAAADLGAYEVPAGSAGTCGGSGWSSTAGPVFDATCAGYATLGGYQGYVYTVSDAQNGGASSICPACNPSGCTPPVTAFCAKGTAGKVVGGDTTRYWGAVLSWNLAQPKTGCDPGTAGTADLTGKTIAVGLVNAPPGLRVNLKVAGRLYCTDLAGQAAASLRVSDFRDQCWLGATAAPITPADSAAVTGIEFSVPTSATQDLPFDFCVSSLSIQ
jgi:parallel beta-helix repeat protein